MLEQAIRHEADIVVVQRLVRDYAIEHGFQRTAAVELAIVASELATNILKYGVRGVIRAEAVTDPERGPGLRILASDEGPPFHDFALAVRDGFDDKGQIDPFTFTARRGLGAGLGAVQRFSDEISWEPTEGGKHIQVLRFLVRPKTRPRM